MSNIGGGGREGVPEIESKYSAQRGSIDAHELTMFRNSPMAKYLAI